MEKDKQNKNKTPIDKNDLICYLGSVFFLILALLPLLLRNFDVNYNPAGPDGGNGAVIEQPKVVSKNLLCNKTIEEEGYSYDISISSVYANDVIATTTITYDVKIIPEYNITFEEIEIPEYNAFTKIESNGIGLNVEGEKYTVNINYALDSSLRQNVLLANHVKDIETQRQLYTSAENGYICTIQ